MPIRVTSTIAILFLGIGVCLSPAQQPARSDGIPGNISDHQRHAARSHEREPQETLTPDDGLSVIAAALDPKVRRYSGRDCSHLVHAIYERAGFHYAYASSDDLYAGVEGFQRVAIPQPGDVIVWHGHAGIVVRPSRHVFFSFMRSGPGIADYESRYWAGRGHPRFYRYIKNDLCAGCTSASTRFP